MNIKATKLKSRNIDKENFESDSYATTDIGIIINHIRKVDLIH